jgi:copper chaperone CopZ
MATKYELEVTGMGCGGCESKVEAALTALEGVERASADHETGKVVVTVATDASGAPRVAPQALSAVLGGIGYPVK